MSKHPQTITFEEALAVWHSTDESGHWGLVDWISRIRSRPALVLLGADEENGGEFYAVMDVTNGHILSEEELSSRELETLDVDPLPRLGNQVRKP